MAEPKDRWDKAEIVSKVLGAIALPLLLWWLGVTYTDRQKDAEKADAKRQSKALEAENGANRVTTLLKSLSSDNVRERKMAIRIAEYFGTKNLLPPDLIPVLLEISENDPDKGIANDAINSLTAVSEANSSLAPEIQQALATSPERIYIHIRREAQRDEAKKVSQLLDEAGFSVPGIERVSIGPDNPEVRYFFPSKQAATAKKIADLVSGRIGKNVNPVAIKGFEGKTNPKQYEVWFAP